MSREESLAAAAEIEKRTNGLLTRSAVAIVGSASGNLKPLGSGTLLAVGDAQFVLSAGHVLREAQELGAVAIGSWSSSLVATVRPWILSGEEGAETDEHDVALYRLTSEEAGRLTDAQFVRIGDIGFDADLASSYFIVSGFPGMWTEAPSASSKEPVKSRLMVYFTTSYDKEPRALQNFVPERHFLLSSPREEMFNEAGEPISFRTRSGYPAPFPDGLRGISGCGVWWMGPLDVPPKHWGQPRLVGVETAVYNGIQAIRATKWNSFTTLLHAAYPDLRPVLSMYIDMYGLR